jgi:hypothetical protein
VPLLDSQPDYSTFPEGEFFDRKKAILDSIEAGWNGYSMDDADFQYLLGKSRQFWSLFHYTNELRIELNRKLIEKDIEILALKELLKEARGQ